MNKKPALLFIASTLMSVSLTSCLGGSKPSSSGSINSTSSTSSPSSSQTNTSGTNNSSSTSPSDEKFKSRQSEFQNVMTETQASYVLPSLGNPKVLVIPVDFSDFTCSSLSGGCDGARARLEDGFFGERTNNDTVESLTSFYEKSSYGKLHIEGYVADWYRSPQSASSIVSKSSEDFTTYLDQTLLNGALKAVQSKGVDLSEYDTDGDGYLDAVWLVYSVHFDPEVSKLSDDNGNFWAYTTWSALEGKFNDCYTGTYAWASWHFMDEGGYKDHPDMHTFIHETGHMMGLDDYYNYDSQEAGVKMTTPAGGLDMMDNNIGDHMAFSKYLLGWITPKTITSSGDYSLDAFAETGDALIIAPDSYINSASWEYLILEYYTPTSLFKEDAENSYCGSYPNFYTEAGLRVYHVDARMGLITFDDYGSTTFKKYVTDIATELSKVDNNSILYPVASNTPSYRYVSDDINLVELVSETFNGNRDATNNDLYGNGDTFARTNFAWHTGETSSFSVKVTSVGDKLSLKVTL
ncbi:MAG TPA: hypothetical protein DCY93_00665 [Firmicutes bacterium]|nr:hypothetical protein [Bacillota bacterium]